ncbi:MAG: hypothetical protein LC687_05895 [Actinobacteria bacterium]|nr:hypothetical protein [Actinomycetota bacterium]
MAAYQHHSQKLIRRRIIASFIIGGILVIGAVAWLFLSQLQAERQLTAVDPPDTSTDEETTSSDISGRVFSEAEKPATELRDIHDNQRRDNIDAIHRGLQVYFSEKGVYPDLTNMNSDSFRQGAFPELEPADFKDPDDTDSRVVITRTPQRGVYAYEPVDANGYTCEPVGRNCVNYSVSAILSDGVVYTLSSD